MDIYLLLKVEFGPRSTEAPTAISGHESKSVAENKALHVLEDYVQKHEGGTFSEKSMRAWDASGKRGIQLNIVKMQMGSVYLSAAPTED